jgi:hypothetical protein
VWINFGTTALRAHERRTFQREVLDQDTSLNGIAK